MAEREFKVKGPDGKLILVTAPEDATDEQIENLAAAKYYGSAPQPKAVSTEDQGRQNERIQILQQEFRDATARLEMAAKSGDKPGYARAEADLNGLTKELNRMGPGLVPGPSTTQPPAEQKSTASALREAINEVDPTRTLINVGGAGAGAVAAPIAKSVLPSDMSAVEKWARQTTGGFSGGSDYEKAYELQKGLRKGAKIGGVQPTFHFQKTPVEVSPLQQAGRYMAQRPKLTGALGGLSAAEGLQERQQRIEGKDIVGQRLAEMGMVGGGLSVLPHPAAKIAGAGLSMASPLALYLYDKLRSEPSPLPATEAELKRAAQPAFVYPRP